MKRKEYQSGDLTIVWKPELCIHAAECVKRLPEVYKPKEKPWINPENAENKAIIEQIKTCPSGALSYIMETENQNEEKSRIEGQIIKNGPLIIKGNICIIDSEGNEENKERASFCRCGASSNKPYCDGSHKANGFEG
jgi:uncharacterized Fe-S cluster protein YjdI